MQLNEWDLNKLHVFRVLAEAGSMRTAARKLLRTPSAISQSISGLERALGFKLFHRVGIRLAITEAGKDLLVQVQRNEQSLDGVVARLRTAREEVSGMVTLGLPLGFSPHAFSVPLGKVLRENAGVRLRLRFMSHPQLAKALRAGAIDLAISLQALKSYDRRLVSEETRKEHLVLVALGSGKGRAGPLWGAERDLSALEIVDYYQKPLLFEQWVRFHRLRLPSAAKVRMYAATLDHVLEFVKSGVGAAVVPRKAVEAELAAGTLVEHPLDRKRHLVVSVWANSASPRSMEQGSAVGVVWKALRE